MRSFCRDLLVPDVILHRRHEPIVLGAKRTVTRFVSRGGRLGLVPQKVPQEYPVRSCTRVFVIVQTVDFPGILDTYGHPRTPFSNLGVKGSQVQILSARPNAKRPSTGRPFRISSG